MGVELSTEEVNLWLFNTFNMQCVEIVEAKWFIRLMEGLGKPSSIFFF